MKDTKLFENLPKQCEKCFFLDYCIEMDCIKEKECKTRKLEPKKLDPDFVQEMKERIGI